MRIVRVPRAAAAAALLLLPLAALAQDKACLMEGSMELAGQRTEIKDCLQNRGIPDAQFRQTCKGLSDMSTALGSKPKLSYLPACPAQPQGVCTGFFGQPLDSYYYKRDPKTLAETQASCKAQGGTWR
ncbi:hypothetical protein LZ017_09995 [Pelomonas sp. CA6]|uniref:hypothetical protein n=1 Tax=Pelomonas sp. CA6 TaxID=2907999 RepID=UPI001F4C0F1D|nr:hypothetical protein [Pelomonas sp. CA6]MCH7343710.1 hypothetical protein [Pelomonas sp. CA6]